MLKGWPEARAELWKYIDSNTIMVGHALNRDFDALRMQHWLVIDSKIKAKGAVGSGAKRRNLGLGRLCKLLGIRTGNYKKGAQNSIKGAFATREVVLWCIEHPEELAAWAIKQREKDLKRKHKREAKKARRAIRKAKRQREQQQKLSSHPAPRYDADHQDDKVHSEPETTGAVG